MWVYEKRLIFPLGEIKPNPRMAKLTAMLLGGPNGEFTAATTYLNQRYCMPCGACRQFLSEFSDSMEVLCAKAGGRYVSYRLNQLLPHTFNY